MVASEALLLEGGGVLPAVLYLLGVDDLLLGVVNPEADEPDFRRTLGEGSRDVYWAMSLIGIVYTNYRINNCCFSVATAKRSTEKFVRRRFVPDDKKCCVSRSSSFVLDVSVPLLQCYPQ